MRPDYRDPYLNLGSVLFQQGRIGRCAGPIGEGAWDTATRRSFSCPAGRRVSTAGSQKVAIAEYHVHRGFRADLLGRNNLAWLLATSSDASIRDGPRAVQLAKQAVRLSRGKDPNYFAPSPRVG